jgi:hypothetical protein
MHLALSVTALLALVPLLLLPSCSSDADDPPLPPPASDGGAGGSDSSSTACALGFLGDPSLDPVIELTVRTVAETMDPLPEGGTVPLVTPPQGGRVIFVGVRATNLSPCSVKLTGTLRDKTTAQIRIDGRTVNLKVSGDGWGASDPTNISTFANIPVCPNQWASTDAYDVFFQLTVSVTDPDGRKAEATIDVTPSCAEPEGLVDCLCTCKKGYQLGQSCE